MGSIQCTVGKEQHKSIKVPLDIGASNAMVSALIMQKLKLRSKHVSTETQNAAANSFATEQERRIKTMLLNLSPTAKIAHKVHTMEGELTTHDAMIG